MPIGTQQRFRDAASSRQSTPVSPPDATPDASLPQPQHPAPPLRNGNELEELSSTDR
ncbi:MAG: hypothetical protein MMC33_001897 [Icmadophila ericetorum]|nr:hypothetical protein [Icmadophila ericetorum]